MKISNYAFSLVEVTLALGIVSFALISLLGLFSVGMKANLDSSHQSVAPEIVQSVLQRLQPVDQPPAIGGTAAMSFNQEGIEETGGLYAASAVIKASGESGWGVVEITITHPGGASLYHASVPTAP